jgi:hypothetical protein
MRFIAITMVRLSIRAAGVVAKSLYGGLRADYSAGGLVLKAHLIASTASAIGRASTKNVPIATETTMRLNEVFSSASNG